MRTYKQALVGIMALCFAGPLLASTPTTTTLVLTPSASVAAGAVVMLTASVSNGAAVTRGTVNFCNSTMPVCLPGDGLYATAQLTGAGTATARLRLGVGTNNIKAVFVGTASNTTSTSSTQAIVVTASQIWASTTSLTSSGSSGNYTLSGTVAGFGNQTLSGTLDFLDTSNGNGQIGSASLGTPTYTMASQAPYSAGSNPGEASVGDFNGDGILDLAVTNASASGNTVSLLLGNGDGTFQTQVPYSTGTQPISVAMGDFNGDGILDLVIANHNDNTVSILLGNGDGTFQTQVTYPTGGQPISVAVGDFNRDGILDLAIVNSYDSTVSILLGNGDGTFQTQVTYPTGTQPVSVALGDFNRDGILDLVIANSGPNTASILFGNGDGTFQTPVAYATGSGPYAISVGDFNGDGILDLATANSNDNTVSVLLGNGDGTYQTQVTYPTGSGPYAISVGDFNGDGILDLAAVNMFDSTVSILFGNGDGTFQTQIPYATGSFPTSASIGDFNGDGILDLAISNQINNTLSVLLGEQIANFNASGISPSGGGDHGVLASYPGDSSRTASESGTVALTVVTTPTITWPSPAPIVYGTALSSVQLDATASVPGTYVYTPASGTVLGAGTQILSVTFTPTDTTDYTTATATTSLTVMATPTITWATPGAINYGTALSAVQLDASSSVAGVFTYSPAAGTVLSVGQQTLSVTFTPSDSVDYTQATAAVSLMVNQAPTMTTLSSSLNPSTFGQNVTLTSMVNTGGIQPTGSVTFKNSGASIGTGTISPISTTNLIPDSNDQNGSTYWALNGSLPVVNGRGPLGDNAFVYTGTGSPASWIWNTSSVITVTPGATYTLSGYVDATAVTAGQPDLDVYSPDISTQYAGVGQNAGVAGRLSVSFTVPAGVTQVVVITDTGNVTANSGGLVVWSEPQLEQTSQMGPYVQTGTTSAMGYGGLATFTTSTLPAGTDSITAVYGGDAADLASTSAALSQVVTQATPTIAASCLPNPVAHNSTYSCTATVSGGATGTVTWPAAIWNNSSLSGGTASTGSLQATAPPGTYGGTVTYNGDANNNAVSTSLSLTVVAATPTITWPTPAPITYGTPLSSTQLDASAGGVAGTFSYSPAAGTVLSAGTHTLQVTFTPTDSTDYTGSTGSVQITVNPAVLTIAANSASRSYNTANPAFSYTPSGFVHGDTASVLSGSPNLTTTATLTTTVGTYPITAAAGTLSASNYTFSFVSGVLTVSQATPTVSVWPSPSAITYGQTLASSALSGGTASTGGAFTWTTPSLQLFPGTPSESVTFRPTDTTDYTSVTGAVTLTVAQAPASDVTLTTTSSINPSMYGDQVIFTVTASSSVGVTPTGTISLMNGTTNLGTGTLNGSGTTTITLPLLNAGSYTITPTYSGDSNYQ